MGNDGAISSLLMGFTQVHVRDDSALSIALSRGISILMYLGFLAMYRGWKSIKPYDSVEPFTAYLPKCTCWCQSRGKGCCHRSTSCPCPGNVVRPSRQVIEGAECPGLSGYPGRMPC